MISIETRGRKVNIGMESEYNNVQKRQEDETNYVLSILDTLTVVKLTERATINCEDIDTIALVYVFSNGESMMWRVIIYGADRSKVAKILKAVKKMDGRVIEL